MFVSFGRKKSLFFVIRLWCINLYTVNWVARSSSTALIYVIIVRKEHSISHGPDRDGNEAISLNAQCQQDYVLCAPLTHKIWWRFIFVALQTFSHCCCFSRVNFNMRPPNNKHSMALRIDCWLLQDSYTHCVDRLVLHSNGIENVEIRRGQIKHSGTAELHFHKLARRNVVNLTLKLAELFRNPPCDVIIWPSLHTWLSLSLK